MVVTILLASSLSLSPHARAEATYIRDGSFDRDTVTDLARRLSRAPFAPPKAPLPKVLSDLDYDHYRDIRVRPSSTLWADKGLFRLQLLPRGFVFTDPVEVALVAGGRCERIAYKPDFFVTGDVMKAPLPAEDIGFSGFRALFPINHRSKFDEVAVFQGASYFRSLGENQVYGLSARGLANKTAEPEGEEFPAFRAFWIEEPSSRAPETLVVHALLDSLSVAGAYRFEIHPGHGGTHATTMDIDAVLFPRVELTKVGLAPETSMFMFSPISRGSADDYRPEVHDSDGLLILNGRGEHIWRPLQNPKQVEVSAFLDVNPAGFGLLQRDRNPADYQDFEALYDRRPSLWIEPAGDWGEGAVVLTEIPSDAEIHDNIVAFWRPKAPLPAGAEYRYAYRASWGDGPPEALERARVVATRVGRADARGPTPVRRFIVDYLPAAKMAHGSRAHLPQAKVTGSAGAIKDVVVTDNPLIGGYRLAFVFDPGAAKAAELRAELTFSGRQTAETWVYRWTAP